MQAVVIAPDPDERDILTYVLRHAGVAVAASGDHKRLLSKWEDHPADVILVAMGEHAGIVETTKEIRAVTQVPLLLLIDILTEREVTKALQAGADVVLTRPASPQVVAAQLTSMLRRTNTVPAFVLPSLNLGAIELDPSTRTVKVEGLEPKRLTQLEFRLLYALMTNRGQVLPTDVIVEKVWGYSGEGNRDLVRGLISRLRHKIEPNPEAPIYLETLSGVGYRLMIDEI
jgi:DNA-binding response OmpR family regulator